ncbi:hypothetical protein pSalSNUABM01_021 [Salmonella phage pSal-SNUABM-01]|nr:hypothetical protein pSalSNUABM01_021 [Salmonella phage pSal-SNUABM-01]
MYSSNGVIRALSATNPDTAQIVVAAGTPNASQFGWTSNDLTNVKDLAQWVSEAQNAAESASTNAQYTADVLTYVQAQVGHIDGALIDVNTIQTQLQAMQADLASKIADFNPKYATFQTNYADFLVKYADFAWKWQQWRDENPIPPITP